MTPEQTEVRDKVKAELKKAGLLDPEFCTDEEITRFSQARKFEIKKVMKMIEKQSLGDGNLQLHVEKLKMTPEQTEVRDKVKAELKKAGLLDPEFCTDEEITRFSQARKFEIKKVMKMIENAVTWRREAKPQNIRPKDIEKECSTGKTFVAGKDKFGRPVIVMDSSVENSKDHNGKIQNLLFHLEHAKRLMPENVDKWVLFIYLDKFSFWNSPPMKTSSETNNCLMLRFPERMGHCFLYQPPTLFSVVWKMASPLIDARTKKKIHFMGGSFAKGSANDKKLNELMGEEWRKIVGVDDTYSSTKARGYDNKKIFDDLNKFYAKYDEEKAAASKGKESIPAPTTQAPAPPPKQAQEVKPTD
eukprot:CAMPEP_0167747060 /NCGR_PEP_ID=MMETSP0110_2-20121227/4064_1 /TAXON_ID=629695 /ORGANISM="Gymnochlora sp., Strain CCMP2014" /LENGTH=358 /DNA_ID=CAMNT_0007631905 /DNA_START=24 /DNA_END=1101 /DNA_ORIENTATION=+